ncbi:DUF2935 domain-containing protein [Paenibacillus sacheonensis]|uniref:DUF2935 domain-containing protein n=1 Tax=Paenibacillus sacheonensis TaxID=742054 RepID=A0A7X5C232_9BACL|nr:DUF2935 domain-containing protein [Paenibacillus sacheonensis]MBM7569466.1 hypothetical protein [Paenibacillus sacheonensis]NBC73366.1 DUF2935 domain-containing protein [Paenibacillus sacheonensis]
MSFEDGARFELRFWLQVFGDHARFIRDALAPGEAVEIARAQQFVQAFDQLLSSARQNLNREGIAALLQAVDPWISQLRAYKLHLLERSLTGNIVIGLAPTFLSHMVNELEEAMRVFAALSRGQLPPPGPAIHQHLLWLQDAVGHAGILSGDFDAIERNWKDKSGEFELYFQNCYLKAIELAGYMRTNLTDFPALRRFNQEANTIMLLFMKFLTEIEELTATKELLGTLTQLIPDHMYREECYYLTKLSQAAAGIPRPDCDPAKPRAGN